MREEEGERRKEEKEALTRGMGEAERRGEETRGGKREMDRMAQIGSQWIPMGKKMGTDTGSTGGEGGQSDDSSREMEESLVDNDHSIPRLSIPLCYKQ